MENRAHLQLLLEKYMEGTASEAETQTLMEAIALHSDQHYWEQLMEPLTRKQYATDAFHSRQWDNVLQSIFHHRTEEAQMEEYGQAAPVRKLRWLRYAAAAVLIMAIAGAYLYFYTSPIQPVITATITDSLKKDAAPGGTKAILTLGNGSHIILDHASNGALADQGNTKVVKLDDGMIAYRPSETEHKEIIYNTMSTPRGGEYSLTLPDGSRVWLNAASSITYPTAFNGPDRKVTVTGEAYFEVAKKINQPFKVSVNDITVEVLGTHFDINSYPDETAVKTTLLEGKVMIRRGGSSARLMVGDQAQVGANGMFKVEKNADIEKTMAWKQGKFLFDKDEIPAILRQLSRWYDVEVEYKAALPGYRFSGIISRSRPLSEVLRILQETEKIHFSIEGKKILVLP